MDIKRGEIYFDPRYEYKTLGNIEDKYLIVLNKTHLPTHPIIVVPVTTDKDNKYNKGCNHRSYYYRIEAGLDYFPNHTLVQLWFANYPFTEEVFRDKKNNHGLVFKTCLTEQTINLITKCLKEIRKDIDSELHKFLF